MPSIVLFSGPIASGKTTVADELILHHGFKRLKSSDYLRSLGSDDIDAISRTSLQDAGDRLDDETDFRWLIEQVAIPQIELDSAQERWLVDCVRKERQVSHFRSTFGLDVLHVHVWAAEEILRARFESRRVSQCHYEGSTTYEEAISHPNEIAARSLINVADLRIDLGELDSVQASAAIVGNIEDRP